MNNNPGHPLEVECQLEERLRGLLGSVPWLSGWKVSHNPGPNERLWDLLAVIPLAGGHKVELYIECRDLPRPSQFPSVSLERRPLRGDPNAPQTTIVPVLGAPWISPRMAELCHNHGWGWFDLAGNCYLSVPDFLHIERTGFDPVYVRPRPEANLGTPESARVLRALLAAPNLGRKWTQRDLRDECQPRVSIGLVNKVVRHLREQAYLMDLPKKGGFKLHDPLGLLNEWGGAYRFGRHLRRDYFTLLRPKQLQETVADLVSTSGLPASLAVFSAAEVQAPHVRESKTWLYVHRNHERPFQERAETKPVDSGGNVVVLFPDDEGVFYRLQQEKGAALPATLPAQTYLDLARAGGRGMEAAEALLEQRLKPEWKKEDLVW